MMLDGSNHSIIYASSSDASSSDDSSRDDSSRDDSSRDDSSRDDSSRDDSSRDDSSRDDSSRDDSSRDDSSPEGSAYSDIAVLQWGSCKYDITNGTNRLASTTLSGKRVCIHMFGLLILTVLFMCCLVQQSVNTPLNSM